MGDQTVVNDSVKRPSEFGQVGNRELNTSEPSIKRRNDPDDSKTKGFPHSWDKLGGNLFTG
jgi:hypothetical protein